jgi:hypothetical protein
MTTCSGAFNNGFQVESLHHLRRENAADILARGACLTGSSYWKNSPQARAAVAGAIEAARAFNKTGSWD